MNKCGALFPGNRGVTPQCENEAPCLGTPHRHRNGNALLTWFDQSPEAQAEFKHRVGNVTIDGIPIREMTEFDGEY